MSDNLSYVGFDTLHCPFTLSYRKPVIKENTYVPWWCTLGSYFVLCTKPLLLQIQILILITCSSHGVPTFVSWVCWLNSDVSNDTLPKLKLESVSHVYPTTVAPRKIILAAVETGQLRPIYANSASFVWMFKWTSNL